MKSHSIVVSDFVRSNCHSCGGLDRWFGPITISVTRTIGYTTKNIMIERFIYLPPIDAHHSEVLLAEVIPIPQRIN